MIRLFAIALTLLACGESKSKGASIVSTRPDAGHFQVAPSEPIPIGPIDDIE